MPKPDTNKTPPQQIDDSTLRQFVGYGMKRAFNVLHGELVETLKPFDLRMVTYSALVMIVENPGLRQYQLADALEIERPNLVAIIDELESRALVVRERIPTDRRSYALLPTAAGKQLCDKALRADAASEARILATLDEKTKATLIEALAAIRSFRKT